MLSELAKNRTHSDQTKALIAKALIGENNPFYNKSHSVESAPAATISQTRMVPNLK